MRTGQCLREATMRRLVLSLAFHPTLPIVAAASSNKLFLWFFEVRSPRLAGLHICPRAPSLADAPAACGGH